MQIRIRGNAIGIVSRVLNVTHWATLAAGFCLVAWPVFVEARSLYTQWSGKRLLAVAAASPQEAVVASRPKSATIPARASRGSLLGSFEIPRLGLSYVLLEGTDNRTLDKSIGHIEGTAHIGEDGNIGIAGHRNTHFRKLEWIRRGDEIILANAASKRVYKVEWIRLFKPEDMEVLDPSHGPAVTLVTCFPFEYVGAAPLRMIVRALPEAVTPRPDAQP